ncbi:SDR family oxidoreductase [Nocardia sp. NPDC004340]
MDIGVKGRVALVMASSTGLGFGVAAALAREGAHVCLCARTREKLDHAVSELRGIGAGEICSEVVDITDEAAVNSWVAGAAERFGRVDILVSNTGGVEHGGIDAFACSDYREAVDSTMLPHIAATLAALPHLQANGWGRIVYITSESIREPIVDNVLSGTVRSGIAAFAKNVSKTAGQYGVTANVVAPGYHRTAALESQFGADMDREIDRLSAELPVGRIGDPGQFGEIVAFLAGESAGFITGTVLLVDGGKAAGV